MSTELLLFHDHASSLHEAIQAAGLASTCPLEAGPRAGSPVAASSPTNQSSPPAAALLPHSPSLPHLSRLLKARGAPSSPPQQQQCNGRSLSQSQSETAIVQGEGNRHGNCCSRSCSRRWRRQTMTAAQARARPRSAGVRRRCPGSTNTSSSHSLGLGPKARSGVGTALATSTNNNAAKEIGLPRQAGRMRPMSAPGRRPEGKTGAGGPRFTGPVEVVDAGGEGRIGAGRTLRTMLGGWSAQDVMDRNAGELSRGGLLWLIRALRENLGATGDGHNEAHHGARQLGANRGPEISEEVEGGRPDAQTLLREQTRRYNDLRVAYASLCRRLEKKGHRGAGVVCSLSAGVGHAGQAKLASARSGSRREKGAKTQQVPLAKPETNVEGGRKMGSNT